MSGTRARRVPLTLAAAVAVTLAAFAGALLAPHSAWRAPLGLAAAVWAPGEGMVAVLHAFGRARVTRLERHALALALGFVTVPVVGILTGALVGLTPVNVTAAFTTVTLVVAGVAWARTPREDADAAAVAEGVPRAPGTRGTVFATLGALAFAGALVVPALLADEVAPPHLALTDADGAPVAFPDPVPFGQAITAVVEAGAGGASAEGRLTARLVPVNGTDGTPVILLDERVRVDARAVATRIVEARDVPTGEYRLDVAWDVDDGRRVHAWVVIASDAREGAP